MTWYAKSGNSGGWWEPLSAHLVNVAQRAAHYGEPLGISSSAYLSGLFHDLAKYSPRFDRRLHGDPTPLDHWSMGAVAAVKRYGRGAIPIACAILGHHVGLKCAHGETVCDELRDLMIYPPDNLTERDVDTLLSRAQTDGLTLPERIEPMLLARETLAQMLDIRMLFSTLVDADAYWSEAHGNGDGDVHYRPRPDGPALDASAALKLLIEHMDQVRSASRAAADVNEIRDDLLAACLEAGAQPPGLFTLAAPTGSGKTWAMLAFALRHAMEHHLRRIIVVIPYLSIIEQTARHYRRLFEPVFGDRFLIENHSLADVGASTGRDSLLRDEQEPDRQIIRLLAENWDAPLIITTSVQCLESLFAHRPSRCRKLHNMARSVIVFDEVQTLPLPLAVPTLAALSRLSERYGSSVLFATATQPAFDHLDQAVRELAPAGWQPRPIVCRRDLFEAIRRRPRYRVQWRLDEAMSWDALVNELSVPENAQSLCIVNLKAHAVRLAEALKKRVEDVFHVSTNMCPAHREAVLADIRQRLESGQPCRVVSTQCVEAGVDIDLPVVYRALAPLEAISQAAGRCNRGGARPACPLIVFIPEEECYPAGYYKEAAKITRSFLQSLDDDERACVLESPDLLRAYHTGYLYPLLSPDRSKQMGAGKVRIALDTLNFAELARAYRLIDNDSVNVLVPFDRSVFDNLVESYERNRRITRKWLQQARPHAVAIFRRGRDDTGWSCLRPLTFSPAESPNVLEAEWFVLEEQKPEELYSKLLGLKELKDQWIA